jgi:hypothetical protein
MRWALEEAIVKLKRLAVSSILLPMVLLGQAGPATARTQLATTVAVLAEDCRVIELPPDSRAHKQGELGHCLGFLRGAAEVVTLTYGEMFSMETPPRRLCLQKVDEMTFAKMFLRRIDSMPIEQQKTIPAIIPVFAVLKFEFGCQSVEVPPYPGSGRR